MECVLDFQQNRCLWFKVLGSIYGVFCRGEYVWFNCGVRYGIGCCGMVGGAYIGAKNKTL